MHYIHPSPFAEASLHFLIAAKLSRKNLPGVQSRESNESNSGLPYSQLSYAATHVTNTGDIMIRIVLKVDGNEKLGGLG